MVFRASGGPFGPLAAAHAQAPAFRTSPLVTTRFGTGRSGLVVLDRSRALCAGVGVVRGGGVGDGGDGR